MHVQLKKEPKSQVVFTIEVSAEEMEPYCTRAAAKISEEVNIEGFRPGKAPYAVVKQRIGEMKIYEAAAEEAVRGTYPKAVQEQKVETIGSPAIDILKMAPGNPFVYSARVSILPSIELGEYKTITLEKKDVVIEEKDVEKVLSDLQKMQTKEAVVDRPATKNDKIVVDMEMFLDRVPVDGGQAKNHAVLLSEIYYIPGFTEQLIGVKKGDVREFELPFPKEHYQKHLAGKKVKFRVTVIDVYELTPPTLDDTFAATVEQKTLVDLRTLLKKNLTEEAEQKERDRQERALLKELVRRSTFGEIPELLLTQESARMVDELEATIVRQGGEFEKYLESIKKGRQQLALDFSPQAVERVKTALAVRAVAEKERVVISDEELHAEAEKTAALYANDRETQERIRSADGREYFRGILRNRRVIDILSSFRYTRD